MHIALLGADHPARTHTEHMIRNVYASTYGALIEAFPPLLVAALNAHGQPLCAAGLRNQRTGFFSECYLDAPVEASISTVAGAPVARGEIIEVTTLAGVAPGLALDLAAFVIAHGRRAGMHWGLFTATAPLRRALTRAGLGTRDLAPARAERVPDAASWGSYYRMRPRVCAVADPRHVPVLGRLVRAARAPVFAAPGTRAAAVA